MARGAKGFSTAAEVLGETASRLKIDRAMRLVHVWDAWASIVGQTVAEHAMPQRLSGKTLIIRVEHPAWMQELSFLKGEITRRISEVSPELNLTEVKFEVGELPAPPKGAKRAQSVPARKLSADEIEFIEQASGEIGDEGVREAARRAMKKGFAARRS